MGLVTRIPGIAIFIHAYCKSNGPDVVTSKVLHPEVGKTK